MLPLCCRGDFDFPGFVCWCCYWKCTGEGFESSQEFKYRNGKYSQEQYQNTNENTKEHDLVSSDLSNIKREFWESRSFTWTNFFSHWFQFLYIITLFLLMKLEHRCEYTMGSKFSIRRYDNHALGVTLEMMTCLDPCPAKKFAYKSQTNGQDFLWALFSVKCCKTEAKSYYWPANYNICQTFNGGRINHVSKLMQTAGIESSLCSSHISGIPLIPY